MSKLHILQHVAFEGAGSIEAWGRQNKFSIGKTEFFRSNWSLPTSKDFDLLIVMGGTMGANDEVDFPWLVDEKRLLEQAITADKKVIGVCLGAQLIASVLGAKVHSNKYKEIGWFDVEKTEEGKSLPIFDKFPDCFSAFHWHTDTYELPAGSSRLFHSQACPEQGFLSGYNILGLQFHLEVTPKEIDAFLESNGEDLVSGGPFVQNASTIKVDFFRTTLLHQLLFNLMDGFMQSDKCEILEAAEH